MNVFFSESRLSIRRFFVKVTFLEEEETGQQLLTSVEGESRTASIPAKINKVHGSATLFIQSSRAFLHAGNRPVSVNFKLKKKQNLLLACEEEERGGKGRELDRNKTTTTSLHFFGCCC